MSQTTSKDYYIPKRKDELAAFLGGRYPEKNFGALNKKQLYAIYFKVRDLEDKIYNESRRVADAKEETELRPGCGCNDKCNEPSCA